MLFLSTMTRKMFICCSDTSEPTTSEPATNEPTTNEPTTIVWELIAPVAADMNTAVRSHSGWYRPEVCIDGIAGLHADRHDFVCLSNWENPDPTRTWLMVDYGSKKLIGRVVITNDYRPGKDMEYINPWEVYVGNVANDPKQNTLCASGTDTSEIITVDCTRVISGRYIYLNLEGGNRRIHIRELQAFTALEGMTFFVIRTV